MMEDSDLDANNPVLSFCTLVKKMLFANDLESLKKAESPMA